MSSPPYKPSSLVPGRYPPPGDDKIADTLHENRPGGVLSPLDGALLHTPLVARGFMSMMGAIRARGKLPDDIREIMILRVAALNSAAFEWFHHEPFARKGGVTTAQLRVIRDANTTYSSVTAPNLVSFNSLQRAALVFTDVSTRNVRIPSELARTLQEEFRVSIVNGARGGEKHDIDAQVIALYTEAAMVVASYNMVSRFLHSADVAGWANREVAWPKDSDGEPKSRL